jgi:hypothetical protein
MRAYRLIKSWELNITSTPLEQRRYFVIKHPVKGMGNKMTTDVNGFLMALMSNRSVIVSSNYPTRDGLKFEHAYSFPASVIVNRSVLPKFLHSDSRHFVSVPTDEQWPCFDVAALVHGPRQFVGISDLLYGPMTYVNPHTARFCWDNFGAHAAYFVGNYFSHFPPDAIAAARAVLAAVPPDRRVLGIHIRFHRAGQYYSHGLNRTMPIVFEEVDRRIRSDNGLLLAVATDNLEIKRIMNERYRRRVLMTDALRKPDKDHQSAHSDMALVLGSDEVMATYRSRAEGVVDREGGTSLDSSVELTSVGVSMIYHWRDHCDWRTNDRVQFCGPEHRQLLQKYFDYLVL